jgi:SpoIID/LytB domain protein
VEYARGFAWAGIEDRQYRGSIEVSVLRDGFTLINEVNLEEYLYSVVPSEMPASSPMEALKAQAVIARSYALHRKHYIKPHLSEGFDLCDGQHCQVYRGAANEWEKTTQAVNETRGKVLTFDGTLISPFYHANCGGHTQSSEDLPGWGSYDYLKGVLDAPSDVSFPSSPAELEKWIKSSPKTYCNSNPGARVPEFRWFRCIPVTFIQEKINRYKPIGDIRGITILGRNTSGHVRSVRIEGSSGSITLEKENDIRRFMGLGPLRSNLFWLEIKYSKENLPELLIIYGGGWGHGVGMCQSGANGMAQRGLSFSEILTHYYQGTRIETLDY